MEDLAIQQAEAEGEAEKGDEDEEKVAEADKGGQPAGPIPSFALLDIQGTVVVT